MTKQLYLSKETEPPERIAELDDAIEAWLEAKLAQHDAAELTKTKHALLVEQLFSSGREKYPYTDIATGKKKFVFADKTPRIRSITAGSLNGKRVKADKESTDEEAEDKQSSEVETRRVPRASVESEIDPFGATRGLLAKTKAKT